MNNLLVLQSDFGLVDGAVSAMIAHSENSSSDSRYHLTTSLREAIVSFRQLITGQQERPLCR